MSHPSPTSHRAAKTGALLLGLALTVFTATPAMAEVRLDTANPLADFTQEGGQSFTGSPTVLSLNDGAITDIVNLYAPDPDAAAGGAVDIVATFMVVVGSLSGADLGVHLVINDGESKAVIAALIVQGGVKGIGLAGGTDFSDPLNYPVFVPVNWSAPTTVRLRRTAEGDGEIVEVNGVAPSPRALLVSGLLAPRNRVGSTFEFGCTSPEATVNVDFTEFFTEEPFPPQVIVPVDGGAATLTPVTINDGAGDQNDPHISGDWVSYASNLSIRYYSFATDIDAEIPRGFSARDLLSDVSGNRVVFSRIITGVKTAVMVFDAATGAPPIEIDAAPGVTRLGSAIGGNTVAYIDSGLQASGELVIHDLTASSSVRITNDAHPDQNPQVSPDGNVVAWEHCLSSLSNCDVWQAVKSGPVWDVGVVSGSLNPEGNPDTNGTLVVYDSLRSGNADIFWKPAAGGAEVQLQMPGVEANPSIAGDFIAFESRPTLFSTSDIFVYDRVKNRLFQVTDTSLVTEQLNDITVLPAASAWCGQATRTASTSAT